MTALDQRGLRLVSPLADSLPGDRRPGQDHGQHRRCHADPGQELGPAPAPFAPALRRAPVEDAAQGQIGQVPSQVRRQRFRLGIPILRVRSQALGDEVRQPHADRRVVAAKPDGQPPDARREPARQHLVQEHAQRVDVGAAVHGDGDGPTPVRRDRGGPLFGGHVCGRPSHPRGRRAVGPDGAPREVEVQEHGLAVGREQDIRGLQVQVHQPALMGVMQGIGQAGPDPARRLDIRGAGEERPGGPPHGPGRRRLGLVLAEQHVEQMLPEPLVRGRIVHRQEQLRQCGAPEIGHAEHPQVPIGVVLHRIERHDVGMLQAGQRQVLLAPAGRDLQHDRPVGQGRLDRQEDPAVGTASQDGQQREVSQHLTHFGKGIGVHLDIRRREQRGMPTRDRGAIRGGRDEERIRRRCPPGREDMAPAVPATRDATHRSRRSPASKAPTPGSGTPRTGRSGSRSLPPSNRTVIKPPAWTGRGTNRISYPHRSRSRRARFCGRRSRRRASSPAVIPSATAASQ